MKKEEKDSGIKEADGNAGNAPTQMEQTPRSLHTPGPWRYEPGGGHAYNSIRGADSVQTGGWPKPINGTSNASYTDRICENLGNCQLPGPSANVRLIVAAPDLLEKGKALLHKLAQYASLGFKYDAEFQDFLAAVTKAEGAPSVGDGNGVR